MKEKSQNNIKKKWIWLGVSILSLIIIGIFVYQYSSFFRCKTNCSIKMEENYRNMNEETNQKGYDENILSKKTKENLQLNSNILLLDVRKKEEYEKTHIPNG